MFYHHQKVPFRSEKQFGTYNIKNTIQILDTIVLWEKILQRGASYSKTWYRYEFCIFSRMATYVLPTFTERICPGKLRYRLGDVYIKLYRYCIVSNRRIFLRIRHVVSNIFSLCRVKGYKISKSIVPLLV